jgi:hypothetical protein
MMPPFVYLLKSLIQESIKNQVFPFSFLLSFSVIPAGECSQLARISHTFSDSSHTLHDDLAVQIGEAVLLEHCPHPSEQQSQSAERRSVQKKCEKSGLV